MCLFFFRIPECCFDLPWTVHSALVFIDKALVSYVKKSYARIIASDQNFVVVTTWNVAGHPFYACDFLALFRLVTMYCHLALQFHILWLIEIKVTVIRANARCFAVPSKIDCCYNTSFRQLVPANYWFIRNIPQTYFPISRAREEESIILCIKLIMSQIC